jgi:enamine deaminase RidA (YjgF/YER057c/UK114 family)
MAVENINPPFLHPPVENLYVHVSKAQGGTHYKISGQVAVDLEAKNINVGDMDGQIRTCYGYIDETLKSLDLGWADVTHLFVFTTEMDEYLEAEKKITPEFFGDKPTAQTLVEVTRLVEKDWKVEVQADVVGP